MSRKLNADILPRLFLKTRPYRVWSFLTLHPDTPLYGKQISEATGVSRGATNQILNDLLKEGVVSRQRYGKMWLYLPAARPLVQRFRVFENLVRLQDLVSALSKTSARVILYGSAAEGTDTADSDIDLFVVSEQPDKAGADIRKFESDREIRPVIMKPAEYSVARTKDKAFIEEVKRGIVLFERETDEQRL
ncbi:MAG: hypothetical protein C4521_02835 [Actinobacteria bacterium]|nr:MAG: hypothetical protein C4521_02835 [Actinomycetota bacterium]